MKDHDLEQQASPEGEVPLRPVDIMFLVVQRPGMLSPPDPEEQQTGPEKL
ncbi:hypothetical protein [Candidatus Aalborgicola defluviihabitans]|nr:hypothetical protein [Burkholderiales bacterium]MBK6569189.1 hypothetical protein [Burkholderiales bacterium]MBK7279249.1 hypothetical protein [Burkholderiales bacterium]MBK7315046.1 hypothetical protein [Burkholderiales bacterium]MBL0242488.1 hypothetical protein [Rhodoferax sp.]